MIIGGGTHSRLRATKHGVIHTPGRNQPYTVWWRGVTICFSTSQADAERRFRTEQNSQAAKGQRDGYRV